MGWAARANNSAAFAASQGHRRPRDAQREARAVSMPAKTRKVYTARFGKRHSLASLLLLQQRLNEMGDAEKA